MKVWHYTAWAKLQQIVALGALRPTNVGAERETPLLWFSANQQWEPTATKMIHSPTGPRQLSFAEQSKLAGCIRFGLDAADFRLLPWADACNAAGTPRDQRRRMEAVGKKKGGRPQDWFGCLASVAVSELVLQVWLKESWLPADPAEMAVAWEDIRGLK